MSHSTRSSPLSHTYNTADAYDASPPRDAITLKANLSRPNHVPSCAELH